MPEYRLSPVWLHVFMLLFALSAILGTLPAYDFSLVTEALAILLASVGLYFAVAYTARTVRLVRAVGACALFAAAAFGGYFILQYGYFGYEKGGIISRIGEITTLLPNLGGFTPQANAAATFLETCLPLGVALTLSSAGRASRIAAAIGTLIVAYAVFLTASRGAWLALGLTAALAIVRIALARLPRRTANALLAVGLVAAAAGLIAIIALGPDRLPFLSSTFSRATDRGRLFLNSLYLAGDYTFSGLGFGDAFAMVYSRYSLLIQVPFLTYAHNLPLSVWLNQGLLGLIALGGIVIAFYRFVFQVNSGFSLRPQRLGGELFHGAWLGVTATLLHGLTDAPQYSAGNRWIMPLLFVVMSLVAAAGRSVSIDAAPDRSRAPVSRRPIIIGAIAAAIVLVILFNQPILAAWHTNLGAIAETRAELAPGLSDAQRAEGYAAANAEYRSALAFQPAQPNANRRAGNLAVKLDDFAAAIPMLETAAQQETSNPAAIKGLGLAYTWTGQVQNAAQTFQRLDDPEAMANELFVWGNFRTEQNRPLLAAYAYETAQAMYPDRRDVGVHLLIADAYRAANQVDDARAWYNRVLEIEPGNERALNALAELGR